MGGGYTSFNARLDNVSSVVYGDGTENVLTVYVDPRAGSGWFYEGKSKTPLATQPRICSRTLMGCFTPPPPPDEAIPQCPLGAVGEATPFSDLSVR